MKVDHSISVSMQTSQQNNDAEAKWRVQSQKDRQPDSSEWPSLYGH